MMIKHLRHLVCGVALVAAVGASSASASNWDPVNTTFHGSQVGTGRLHLSSGAEFVCTRGDTDLRVAAVTPSVASTSTVVVLNPIQWSNCTGLGFTATVTTHGAWIFTGVSTTNVSLTARPTTAGGSVLTASVPVVGCSVTLGETTIAGNTWNNTSKFLTLNSASTFPVSPSSEACGTLLGTSGNLESTLFFPAANLT
jgi:hypothetical protein